MTAAASAHPPPLTCPSFSHHDFPPQDLQSKELPSTRIRPDRRWFGNTRVIGQKQLDQFRDEMSTKVNDAYTVLLREKKLPLQLLEDPDKKLGGKLVSRIACMQWMPPMQAGRIGGRHTCMHACMRDEWAAHMQVGRLTKPPCPSLIPSLHTDYASPLPPIASPLQLRSNLLATQPFKDVFGPNRKRKKPKLASESLMAFAETAEHNEDT